MRKLLLILILGLPLIIKAQHHEIILKHEPLKVVPSNYFIDGVIDDRVTNSHIGYVKIGPFNRRVAAIFNEGLAPSITAYLDASLPKDTLLTPVVVKITYLQISEETTITAETGRVELSIEFYERKETGLHNVFDTDVQIEETTFDATASHEERIRNALAASLQEYNDFEKSRNTYSYVTDTDEVQLRNEPDVVYNERPLRDKNAISNVITFNHTQGKNATGWGLSYVVYNSDFSSGWVIPWRISIERFSVNPDYFKQFNYYSAQWNYFMPGVSIYRRLNDYFYLDLTFNMPLGTEKLEDFSENTKVNFVIGAAPSQGLLFISKSVTGVTFGIGVYERIFTADTYKSDIGFKVDFGIKF